ERWHSRITSSVTSFQHSAPLTNPPPQPSPGVPREGEGSRASCATSCSTKETIMRSTTTTTSSDSPSTDPTTPDQPDNLSPLIERAVADGFAQLRKELAPARRFSNPDEPAENAGAIPA